MFGYLDLRVCVQKDISQTAAHDPKLWYSEDPLAAGGGPWFNESLGFLGLCVPKAMAFGFFCCAKRPKCRNCNGNSMMVFVEVGKKFMSAKDGRT